MTLYACRHYAAQLALLDVEELKLIGRSIVGVLAAWMAPPGMKKYRRNAGVFQLLTYHLCMNGLLASLTPQARHVRI